MLKPYRILTSCLTTLALLVAGCSGGSNEAGSETTSAESVSTGEPAPQAIVNDDGSSAGGVSGSTAENPAPTFYKPITLGGGSSSAGGSSTVGTSATDEPVGPPPTPDEIMAGLKPVATVLVGEWTSILKNASINEAHNWFWDVKSDPAKPSIVLQIPDGQFFTEARISYSPRKSQFTMTTTDAEKTERSYVGTFDEPPQNIPSDDGKSVERTFKLAFEEQDGADQSNEKFRYVIAQQNNNRYLMEIHRARGSAAFRLRDVGGTQRNGVSFAKADDDYGDRTCVISGGLGTSTVTFKGKTYYVCCSGCAAAFNDDPEKWIAKFEAAKNEKQN
jgi:hypothetical protein